MAQLQQDVGQRAIVADSALYTAETLAQMNGYTWITRVPETLTLAKEAIALTALLFAAQPDEQQHIELCTTYADTRQRWLLIYSPAARQRALKTANTAFAKQSQQELKAFEALCHQEFACEADAEAAVRRFRKQLKLTTLTVYQLSSEAPYQRRGRPTGRTRLLITLSFELKVSSPQTFPSIRSDCNGKAALFWPPMKPIRPDSQPKNC